MGSEVRIIKSKTVVPTHKKSRRYTELNTAKTNLRYHRSRLFSSRSDIAYEISHVSKQMRIYDNIAKKLLDNNGNSGITQAVDLAIWAGIYVELPALTGKDSSLDKKSLRYILALIFVRRYAEAEQLALSQLAENKDNYGANVLLGLLSIRNKAYFKYLEKAFSISSQKTVYMVIWQAYNTEIKVNRKDQWDFFDAFIKMTSKQIRKSDFIGLPRLYGMTLYSAIREKYYDDKTHRLKPENQYMSSNLSTILHHLQIHMTPDAKHMVTPK